MRSLTKILLIMFLLNGCVTVAEQRLRYGAERFDAYTACSQEGRTFGLIPDFGITQDLQLLRCMEKAGWTQNQRWRDAHLIGLYERPGTPAIKCPAFRACEPLVKP